LEPGIVQRVHIRDAAEAVAMWVGPNGGLARVLGSVTDRDIVEFWEWILQPGDNHASTDHPPGTRELLHVLSGVLTVTADGTDFSVDSGQTIDFVADSAHGYRNDGDRPARVLMVTVQPAREWDRRPAHP
jgi:quercetin dioxygenase-like cupin family protein